MSWIGAGIGALVGSVRGGILGGLLGAMVGNWLERLVRESMGSASLNGFSGKGELTLLAALSAMMAKMSKADGRITEDEIRYCETVFDQLGLRGEKRAYCIRMFRSAKDDNRTIYEYANAFAATQRDLSVRTVVYSILWDVACSDGRVTPVELQILRQIAANLRLPASCFEYHYASRRAEPSAAPSASDPYAVLGVSRNAGDEAVRKAYREKAKALHPDRLRAKGLSEELLGRANAEMARVNEAWALIKKQRGIR